MADFSIVGPSSQYPGTAQAQADRLVQGLRGGRSLDSDQKIDKAGKDFESLLLNQWLQEAEKTFAAAPGAEADDEDADPGADQFQGMGMQSLATAMTNAGGIGIARTISQYLHRSEGKTPVEGTAAATGGMLFRQMPK